MASFRPSAPLTVSEINRRSRQLLENQIGLVWVVGEISRATLASSGHWYFVLKDEGAAIDCAMFQGRAQHLDFRPENGLKVEVRARVTIYEPRGAYQLAVEQMRHAGLGALFEAFEKLKARLGAEGLFEESRKKPLQRRPPGVSTPPARLWARQRRPPGVSTPPARLRARRPAASAALSGRPQGRRPPAGLLPAIVAAASAPASWRSACKCDGCRSVTRRLRARARLTGADPDSPAHNGEAACGVPTRATPGQARRI